MSDLNIHIFDPGEKDSELTCNWCKEPHAMDAQYKAMMLERGRERIEELSPEAQEELRRKGVGPKETWTCGRCMLVLNGMEPDAIKTDCHDHEVPPREE